MMDSIFLLDDGSERTNLLQHLALSFGCSYLCLWSYLPHPSNCLIFKDGFYNEEDKLQQQPSSSSSTGTTLAMRLFDAYRQSIFPLHIESSSATVPGLAFSSNLPFIELKDWDLQRRASIQTQLQFYQEARIKTAIFMGCKTGEIELGISNIDPQRDLGMEMRNWFPEDMSRQSRVRSEPPIYPTDHQNPLPSSSSSSLRSLSMDSPDQPHQFLFNLPITPSNYVTDQSEAFPILSTTTATSNPLQEAIQAISRFRSVQIPSIESEDAAMTKAMLAVLSSSTSSSSSYQQNLPDQTSSYGGRQSKGSSSSSAFRNYRSVLAPSVDPLTTARGVKRQNMLKRSIAFFRSLGLMRTQEQGQGSRPTTTQLHHMISERRRREKLNESFQALRSLLPPGTKKDKASVLTSTTEYLSSLQAQVAELTKQKQLLEAQISPQKKAKIVEEQVSSISSGQRIDVRVTDIDESTSEARTIDLQVSVRGECSLLDLTIRVLEFLKQVHNNASLITMEAQTHVVESNPINLLSLRLKIEGNEWDESAFQEAVRRVVADLAH